MALPEYRPLNEIAVYGSAASVTTGQSGVIYAPCRGVVRYVGTVLGGAVTTADATVTTSITGTAITGGAFTITQSGSAVNDVDGAVPTAANVVNEGDVIRFAFTGSGTAGGAVNCVAIIRKI